MFDFFSQCFKLTDKYDKKEKAIEKHGQDFEISNKKTTFVKNTDIVAFLRCEVSEDSNELVIIMKIMMMMISSMGVYQVCTPTYFCESCEQQAAPFEVRSSPSNILHE